MASLAAAAAEADNAISPHTPEQAAADVEALSAATYRFAPASDARSRVGEIPFAPALVIALARVDAAREAAGLAGLRRLADEVGAEDDVADA